MEKMLDITLRVLNDHAVKFTDSTTMLHSFHLEGKGGEWVWIKLPSSGRANIEFWPSALHTCEEIDVLSPFASAEN